MFRLPSIAALLTAAEAAEQPTQPGSDASSIQPQQPPPSTNGHPSWPTSSSATHYATDPPTNNTASNNAKPPFFPSSSSTSVSPYPAYYTGQESSTSPTAAQYYHSYPQHSDKSGQSEWQERRSSGGYPGAQSYPPPSSSHMPPIPPYPADEYPRRESFSRPPSSMQPVIGTMPQHGSSATNYIPTDHHLEGSAHSYQLGQTNESMAPNQHDGYYMDSSGYDHGGYDSRGYPTCRSSSAFTSHSPADPAIYQQYQQYGDGSQIVNEDHQGYDYSLLPVDNGHKAAEVPWTRLFNTLNIFYPTMERIENQIVVRYFKQLDPIETKEELPAEKSDKAMDVDSKSDKETKKDAANDERSVTPKVEETEEQDSEDLKKLPIFELEETFKIRELLTITEFCHSFSGFFREMLDLDEWYTEAPTTVDNETSFNISETDTHSKPGAVDTNSQAAGKRKKNGRKNSRQAKASDAGSSESNSSSGSHVSLISSILPQSEVRTPSWSIPDFATILGAIYCQEDTCFFRQVLVFILRPLLTASYETLAFTGMLSELDTIGFGVAANPGSIPLQKTLRLCASVHVDELSVGQVIRMYIADNANAFKLMCELGFPLPAKEISFQNIMERLMNCNASEEESKSPSEESEPDEGSKRKRRRKDIAEPSSADSTEIESSKLYKDPLLSLSRFERLQLILFLLHQWLEIGSLNDHIEEALQRIPEIRRQVKRDNNAVRATRRDLILIRREMKMLDDQIVDLQQMQAGAEQEGVDPSQDFHLDAVARIEGLQRDVSERKVMEQKLIDQLIQMDPNGVSLLKLDGNESMDTFQAIEDSYMESIRLSQIDGLRLQRNVRNMPVGFDRFGREYWVFQSMPGLFIRHDQQNPHPGFEFVGHAEANEDYERPITIDRNWHWIKTIEEFDALLQSLDDHNSYDESRLALSLQKYRTIAFEEGNNFDLSDGIALELKFHGVSKFTTQMYSDLRRCIQRVGSMVFSPCVNKPRSTKYQHFNDIHERHNTWLPTAFPSNNEPSLDSLREAVVEWFNLLDSTSLESGPATGALTTEAVQSVQKKRTSRKKKGVLKFRPVPDAISPLLFCFLSHDLQEMRTHELKSIDRAFSNWIVAVRNADLESLRLCCYLLERAVVGADGTVAEAGVYSSPSSDRER